ncbi:phospholipase, partial [Halobacteriales archaeon QS_6_71_20]
MSPPDAPVVALLALALSSAATAPAFAAADAASPSGASNESAAVDPRIVELLPNPVADGDSGEYVRLVLPRGNWTVTDGESAVTVTRDDPGPVVLTADPEAPLDPPEGRVVAGGLSLSNGGERVELRRGTRDGPVVDAVEYGRAPEGDRWLRGGDPHWRPVGLPDRDPVDL